MEKIYTENPQVRFSEDLGWYTKPGEKGVAIILHGSNASPINNEPLAKVLWEKGYGIESPLLSGHGIADFPQSDAQQIREHVQSLVSKVKQQNNFCVVIGTSMGGTLALLSGMFTPAPDMIVSVSGALSCSPDQGHPWVQTLNRLKTRLRQELPFIKCPTLLLHDIDDINVKPEDAWEVMNMIGSKRKKCVYYSGSGHSLMFSNYCYELAQDIETFRSILVPAKKVQLSYQGNAKFVYLAGEFNNWKAYDLAFTSCGAGKFAIEMELAPGNYPYKLIVDGQWILDPTASIVPAPNGEKNSLLVVPK